MRLFCRSVGELGRAENEWIGGARLRCQQIRQQSGGLDLIEASDLFTRQRGVVSRRALPSEHRRALEKKFVDAAELFAERLHNLVLICLQKRKYALY
jgi:hypothetical protein